MAFEFIPTVRKQVRDARAAISYKRPKTGSKLPRLVVGLPKAICGAFKPKDGETFGFALGVENDSGVARIIPSPDGARPQGKRGAVIFNFGHVPMLGKDAAEKEYVDAKAIKDGFELKLPPWFR